MFVDFYSFGVAVDSITGGHGGLDWNSDRRFYSFVAVSLYAVVVFVAMNVMPSYTSLLHSAWLRSAGCGPGRTFAGAASTVAMGDDDEIGV